MYQHTFSITNISTGSVWGNLNGATESAMPTSTSVMGLSCLVFEI